MANDHALHRCVTEFMLDTCRYDTKQNYCALAACLTRCIAMTAGDGEVFSSGSCAKFYIEPMLPYVGDIDVMSCFNHCLAIPAGHTPPTELSSHFLPNVTAYEIIDSHQPGFVYLMTSCVLMRNENGIYVVKKRLTGGHMPRFLLRPDIQDTAKLVANKCRSVAHFPDHLKQNVHGPAVQIDINWPVTKTHSRFASCNACVATMMTAKYLFYFDYVLCMRCQCWPLQAADWPNRIRDHGIPDHTSINMVVSNGCDLVGAVHPHCRQDEWMNEHQWRLSFSRACLLYTSPSPRD